MFEQRNQLPQAAVRRAIGARVGNVFLGIPQSNWAAAFSEPDDTVRHRTDDIADNQHGDAAGSNLPHRTLDL